MSAGPTKTIWQTRTGQRIRVKDMTDSHLLNTYRLLYRTAAKHLAAQISTGYSVLSSLQGDMAQFYCEQDIDRLEETSEDDWLSETIPTWDAICAEIERRKLNPNL